MKWEVFDKKRIFDRVHQIWEISLRFELFQGGVSNLCRWFVLEKGYAVAGLIFDPRAKKVLLVKQFRPMVIFFPEDTNYSWMVEIVAGGLKAKEDPLLAFLREVKEETSLELAKAEKIMSFYPSPGFYGERVHLFYAEFDSKQLTLNPQGLVEENENVLPVLLSLEEVRKKLLEGFFIDAKTILALQWLLLHKS